MDLERAGFDRSVATAWSAEGLLAYLPGTLTERYGVTVPELPDDVADLHRADTYVTAGKTG